MRSWVIATDQNTCSCFGPRMVLGLSSLDMNGFFATPAFLCLIFALVIQIGTNFANDYYDFLKGADSSNVSDR